MLPPNAYARLEGQSVIDHRQQVGMRQEMARRYVSTGGRRCRLDGSAVAPVITMAYSAGDDRGETGEKR